MYVPENHILAGFVIINFLQECIMAAGICVLLAICILLAWFKQRKFALIAFAIVFVLCLALFKHHATDALNISL